MIKLPFFYQKVTLTSNNSIIEYNFVSFPSNKNCNGTFITLLSHRYEIKNVVRNLVFDKRVYKQNLPNFKFARVKLNKAYKVKPSVQNLIMNFVYNLESRKQPYTYL